jgi:hypothetical protein
MEASKVINSLATAVGQLNDEVAWSPWRAKFVRLCALYGVDVKKADDYGYVNAVLELVAVKGSSVAAVLETYMLRDSDSYSLLGILDDHFKLVDNPLSKIRRLKELSFESSSMNLLDFARAVFALCQDCGVAKESDMCLWVLAGFGSDVMAKMPQDVLLLNTKESLTKTLASVMTKFDMQKDGKQHVDAIDSRGKSSGASQRSVPKDVICFSCGEKGHYSTKCPNPKLSEEEQQKLRDAFNAKRKKREASANVSASVKAIVAGPGKQLRASVVVDGAEAVALMDTGATISLIHPDVLKPQVRATRRREIVAKFANNESAVLKEQVRVHVAVDGKEYDHWMYVYPKSTSSVLLGMDFLEGKANIDLVRGAIEFHACAVETVSPMIAQWHEKSLKSLEKIQDVKVRALVEEYIEKFYAINRSEWLPCKFREFEIKLRDDVPISATPYRYAQSEQDVISSKFKEWMETGFARRSTSEFSSPALLVDKPQPADELYRVCGNYRRLNKKTVPKKYPMPNIDEVIDRAKGRVFSVVDAVDAYHQVAIKESDVHKTALVSHNEKIELLRMQYGMVGAGFHFQEGVDEMLGEARGEHASAVVDDILVFSGSDEEHLQHLRDVLERMYVQNLLPKFWKCQFAQEKVLFCGREISERGVGLGRKKVEALLAIRAPESKAELESVIGLVIWHAKWIPRIGEVMLPLIECRKQAKSGAKFPWSKECDEALAKIKKAIAQATLRSRTGPGVYHIYTDAAEFCVSWHVVREDRGQQHLMEFGSHVLTDAEIRYSMPKKELFAIALASKKSRWMCLGREVVIHTDQIAWARELDLKSPTGVLARWLEWANELNPKTVFICGEENVVADCLSRLTPVKGSASAEDVVCAIETTKERAKAIEEQMKRGPVFVPVEWRRECLRAVHDGFLGAHLGATKMWECLRERYTWPGMSEDVKAYKCELRAAQA